jgi:hypothetical protein
MIANIVVGSIIATILILALIKSKKDLKNNKCGSCSACANKNTCNIVNFK